METGSWFSANVKFIVSTTIGMAMPPTNSHYKPACFDMCQESGLGYFWGPRDPVYTGWLKNSILFLLYQMLANFTTYSAVTIRRKFLIILSLKIASHLRCVATLTCEMTASSKQ